MALDHQAKTVDRKLTAVICQWVEDHGCVLSSLDNLVEVADRPFAHGPSERTVHPVGLAALQEESTHEIGRGEIVMTRDRDQRAVEIMGHGFDKSRLSTPSGTLQDYRQTLPVRRLEYLFLVTQGKVVRALAGLHGLPLSIWWRSLDRSFR